MTTVSPSIRVCLAILVCVSGIQQTASGARVLMVPANVNSHVMYFSRLGEGLAELGHSVHLLVASNARLPPSQIGNTTRGGTLTTERYPVDGDVPFVSSPEVIQVMTEAAATPSIFKRYQILIPFMNRLITSFAADCTRLLGNSDLLATVRSAKYDVAIMDPAFGRCFVLPYAADIPHHAALSVPVATLAYRVPRLPSFVSAAAHTDRMSFVERLSAFCLELLFDYVFVDTDVELSERFASHRAPIAVHELIVRSSFWLYLEDVAVGYPRPLMPNTVPVGDLMAGRPGRPLPADLERFVGESLDGVIVVSFGSFLDDTTADFTRRFCQAFLRLRPGLGVVWKLRHPEHCPDVFGDAEGRRRPRVLASNWLPQNDLLADRRVRAFVTHGGISSIVEAVYHAKPVVVVPIALDQPANAAAAEYRGYGRWVDLADPDFVGDHARPSRHSRRTGVRRHRSRGQVRRRAPAHGRVRSLDRSVRYVRCVRVPRLSGRRRRRHRRPAVSADCSRVSALLLRRWRRQYSGTEDDDEEEEEQV